MWVRHRRKDNAVSPSYKTRRRAQVEGTYKRHRSAAVSGAVIAIARCMQLVDGKKWAGLACSLKPFTDRKEIARAQRKSHLLDSWSRQSDEPAYATRSTLEALVLLKARLKLRGIKVVMIDYAKRDPREGINWRVVGLISGTADRDAAFLAIKAAAEEYAMWVMVDDADPLVGHIVKHGSEA